MTTGVVFFLALFPFKAFAWDAQTVAQFNKANQSYREGHFKDAIAGYRALTEKYPGAGVFFYNLGNSFYRIKDTGSAILAYERARMLDPRDADIRNNLHFVRGLLEYRIEDKRNWYVRAGERLLGCFTGREITFLAALAYFLFMTSWAFVLFFRRDAVFGWKRKSLLVFLIFTAFLAGAKHVQLNVIRDAIVMAKEAEVRYGPSENDKVAFRLGEGLKVYVVDVREDWSRILLANGESGWVPSGRIAEVRR